MIHGATRFFGLMTPALALGIWAGSAAAQTPSAPGVRYVVVLDAAHGGGDSGGTLTGSSGQAEMEKDYTLAFSVRLRSLLAARGIGVVTTRESDAGLDAMQRAQTANRAHAQACLTLHASMSGSGVHLFISSLQPAAQPARSDPDAAYLPLRLVPWRTAQATVLARSVALAGTLNSALLHAGLPVTLGRTELTTIDSMTCPAVAVEIAPEAARSPDAGAGHGAEAIDDPGYEARVAGALAAGLLEWGSTAPPDTAPEGAQP
ncbi:MAG TPA: N-acetylmuramoyl-L-alanine amidase [Terracidiphilus sp.]|nr:N-acetylmuramoyl-L-alanine amidase [Terracidiphilus sp.]